MIKAVGINEKEIAAMREFIDKWDLYTSWMSGVNAALNLIREAGKEDLTLTVNFKCATLVTDGMFMKELLVALEDRYKRIADQRDRMELRDGKDA
jgi:hypothetical protein